MTEQQDRDAMLSIFLMEAWDTLVVLEEGLSHPPEDGGDTTAETLLVVTHRLKGSAALYEFPGLASLARAAEALLEQSAGGLEDERQGLDELFRELISLLKAQLEAIQRTGSEEVQAVSAFLAKHGLQEIIALRVEAEAAPAVSALLEVDAGTHRAAPDGLVEELDSFFRQNPDVLEYFGPEAAEHLETMTASLLDMEQSGASQAGLATLFRAAHTLKGAAYTVGCRVVGDLAHQVEDLLAAVREERVAFSPECVDAVLGGIDALRLMLGQAEGRSAELSGTVARAVGALRALTPVADASPGDAIPIPEVLPVGKVESPAESSEERGAEPRSRQMRTRIRVALDRLDSLMALVGELVIARSRLDQRLLQLERVDEALHFNRARMSQAVGEFERKYLYRQVSAVKPGRELLGAPVEDVRPVADVFAELEFDRYDDFNILARSLGEISTDLAELQSQTAGLIRSIRGDTGQIQQLTGQLRNEVTRTRMVPIGTLFARFSRQVREAARAGGRVVALEASGEAVEVDTRIIEQLSDPLLHLVRNAIAHGLEDEAERRALGKSPHGALALRAAQRGGFVYVEVEDDGRGIDAEAIRGQAVAQGLLQGEAASALSPGDVLNLIFLPGFSTAGRVTADSGRGVGLDVVRTNISRLNGEIQVETEVGVGTRFTLKLPLTVLISDALMARVGTEILAVPLNAVQHILSVAPGMIQTVGRTEMIELEGHRLELFGMDRLLGLPASERSGELAVLVLRSSGRAFAVHVDELLGKEEVVIKHLGDFLADVGPFAGATISGEGRVILLVDPNKLLERGEHGPALSDTLADRLPERLQSNGGSQVNGEARRILLVDDSVSVRKFVGAMLEKAGFDVVTAVDGAEAIERLRELPVHVVVTDLEMPRVNGYELIEHLRRQPATQGIPVVVLTTRAGEKHVNLARRLGVEHYVTKPVDDQAFVRLILSIGVPAQIAVA